MAVNNMSCSLIILLFVLLLTVLVQDSTKAFSTAASMSSGATSSLAQQQQQQREQQQPTASNNKNNNNNNNKKTIILIRHAESEENRRLYSLIHCVRQLGRLSLTSLSICDVLASMEFFNIPAQIDTPLSELGVQQVQHVRSKLEASNFIQNMGIQLVVHSPLIRARQTSHGVLGCLASARSGSGSSDSGSSSSAVQRVVELETLSEKLPHEWIPVWRTSFEQRIAALEAWLEEQPESVIALVGHSDFFKAMLGVSFKFHNCEVWQASFETQPQKERSTSSSSCRKVSSRWTNLRRLHTCEISRTTTTSTTQ